jgi:glutathione S-transferase
MKNRMLTVHHLARSQSERIVWLCEELGLPYELKCYARTPATGLAPPELANLHPMRNAPVITDGELVMAESGAIVDYITTLYGNGRLRVAPDHPDFAQFVYWFHFANGSLQNHVGRTMVISRAKVPLDNPVSVGVRGRMRRALDLVETRLGTVQYLAGPVLTAADIMSVFTLTTMRLSVPIDLAPYPNIRAYLARIGTRESYRRAMRKAEPGLEPLLT